MNALLASAFVLLVEGALAQSLPANNSGTRLYATTTPSPAAASIGGDLAAAHRRSIMEQLLAHTPQPLNDEAANASDPDRVFLMRASLAGPPLLQRSRALTDSGGAVNGSEEGLLRGLIYGTALAALLGLLLSGVAYSVVRRWSQHLLRRIGVALNKRQAAPEDHEACDGARRAASPESIAVPRGEISVGIDAVAVKASQATFGLPPPDQRVDDPAQPEPFQSVLARARKVAGHAFNTPVPGIRRHERNEAAIDADTQGSSVAYDGEPVIHVVMRDITQRKQVQDARARTSELLHRTGEMAKAGGREMDRRAVDFARPSEVRCNQADDTQMIPALDQAIDPCAPTPGPTMRTAAKPGTEFDKGWDSALSMFPHQMWPNQPPAEGRAANDEGDATGLREASQDIAGDEQGDAPPEESEAGFRTLVEWSPEPLVVYRGAKTIYANPAALTIFGATSAQDLVGRPFLDLVHPDFQQNVLSRLQNLAGQGAGAPKVEERLLKLDGTAIDVEIHGSSVLYDGEPAHFVAFHDITDRKQAEAAHASLEAQLRESQKMEAIGTLASGIAHDFNNIIATILGNTELARQDVSANPVALASLEEIRKAAARARDLVQQILSFSRRQSTERKPTALAPIVRESARLLRATLPARLTLKIHCSAEVPAVLADATQIEQVLLNLATNAMQAMQGGPGRIGIRLDTVLLDAAWVNAHPALRALRDKHPGRTVRLTVSDTGPGMDAATLERIFEPFFTTKVAGVGTGLGLSVVDRIVQEHEGAIVVTSKPGKGATFTVYLPAAEAATGAPAPEEDASAAVAATPSGPDSGPHILYLDDDESLVVLVKRLLERRGYCVTGHTDQREALAAVRAEPGAFDLVVTDYNMPGMSGLDVAREVRAIRADLPVAVASGLIDGVLRAQADGAGVREFIFKANAAEDLCEAFARLAQTLGKRS